ncbi:hypothetical protein LPJ62_003189, partial [Coemansia sp. RSA 2167]
MSSTGSDEEDVDISEAVGHAANPGVADESADEPTRTGLLHNEDTHEDEVHPAQSEDEDTREEEVSHAQSEDEDTREDEAESSAATVSNMSEDLFDMCLDTFGTAAAIGDTPVGTAAAIGDAPVGTAAAIGDAPVGTAAAIGDMTVGTAAAISDAPVGTAAAIGDAPVGTAAAIGDAPVGTSAPNRDAPVGTSAPIRDVPVGMAGAIRNVPVGTTAAIRNAPVGTTAAAYHGLPVVSRSMTLGLKRPRPGSKCVDEPATKKVMIDPYEDLTDPSEQELNIILTNYPGRRPAITSGMKKLALALYAKPPDVSSITKLSNVPPHARAPTQPAAPNVVAGHTVTLKDISKAKGRGEAVMNLVQAFEYVLWVAKWEVALRRNFPERERLFMEMLPVVDIANGQHKGQTIIDLNRALGLQASNAKEFDKVVKDMMGGEIVGKAREDFN